jgi:hypothetical protein
MMMPKSNMTKPGKVLLAFRRNQSLSCISSILSPKQGIIFINNKILIPRSEKISDMESKSCSCSRKEKVGKLGDLG